MSESRKIAAILVADVAGFSRRDGADDEGTVARLRALRCDLIDSAVSAHHGRKVTDAHRPASSGAVSSKPGK